MNEFKIDLEKEAKRIIKEYEEYYKEKLTNMDMLQESKVWEYSIMVYTDKIYEEIKKQLKSD